MATPRSTSRVIKRRLTEKDGVDSNSNREAMVLEQDEEEAPDMVLEEVHAPYDETDPMADANGDHRTGTEDQVVTDDVHKLGGTGTPMSAPQPQVNKATPPSGYVVDDAYEAVVGEDGVVEVDGDVNSALQRGWFEEDPANDSIVYPKKDIYKKVFPPNTVTPTFVLLATKHTQMTKAEVELLGG